MPLRGKTVIGVLYLSCREAGLEGHAELVFSQVGDRICLVAHHEGEVFSNLELPCSSDPPMLVLIRAVLPGLAAPVLRDVTRTEDTNTDQSTLIA
jgi:hypothetical protein